MVVNNSAFLEVVAMEIEGKEEKCDVFGNAQKVFDEKAGSNSSSDLLTSEETGEVEEQRLRDEESSSSSAASMGWPLHKTAGEGEGEEREVSTNSGIFLC